MKTKVNKSFKTIKNVFFSLSNKFMTINNEPYYKIRFLNITMLDVPISSRTDCVYHIVYYLSTSNVAYLDNIYHDRYCTHAPFRAAWSAER